MNIRLPADPAQRFGLDLPAGKQFDLVGLGQNWPLQQIMAFANAAAGLNCPRLGARPATPPLIEILQFADGTADER